jgi:hypothetical protein
MGFATGEAAELRFSTYLGGSALDNSAAIAADRDGNIYVAGYTRSSDFPIRNTIYPFRGGPILNTDLFVAKFSRDGALIYATFLGGSTDEIATDLAVDQQGRIYVVGGTSSNDFPSVNSLYDFRGGGLLGADGFVLRLSADGTAVEFATFLGGTGDETLTSVAVDAAGNVYLAGETTSEDFPTTTGAFQTGYTGGIDGGDAFAAKLRSGQNGTMEMVFTTFLGDSLDDIALDVAADTLGRAFVVGATNSQNFPIQHAIQGTFAGPERALEGDIFVSCLNADGKALDFSTYFGGSEDDRATAVTLDAEGNIYLTGWSNSDDFPTTPAGLQPQMSGLTDAFVLKLTSTGPEAWAVVYATFLGGPGPDKQVGLDRGIDLVVDARGNAYVLGVTDSEMFPTVDPIQPAYGGGTSDAFVALLDPDGTILQFSTLLGGRDLESAAGLALARDNVLCVTGNTNSDDFPTHNGIQLFDGPGTGSKLGNSVFVSCLEPLITAVAEDGHTPLPTAFALYQNYPNPFNPQTSIRFDVKSRTRVVIKVFDVLGRQVATLVNEDHKPGRYQVLLDAHGWASGLYFYQVEMGDFKDTKKMVLLR